MRRPVSSLRTRGLLTALVTLGATAAGLAVGGAAHAATPAATPLPTHVFAPYLEAYNGDSPLTLSQESGTKYLTLAFITADGPGSCGIEWDGDNQTPISSSVFGSDINTMRANGGDVIPSFGGAGADNDSTEIADSCTNVSSIAADYENVITTYNVSRLDFDVEGGSETNSAGIDRRNKAIAQVESWAAANGRSVQFSYTLPATPSGLDSTGLAVVQNAVQNNAAIAVVNMMTFDYYDGSTHEMANDTETAGQGLVNELSSLYPGKSSAQLWNMVGITEMIGIDDYGPPETFTTADATTVLNWANSKGINLLSFWAIERDNGGCPGTSGSDSCSGISQSTWYFDHTFESFTSSGGTTPPPGNTVTVTNPGTQTTNTGASVSLQLHATDSASGQSLTYSASGLPAGLSISSSGLISGAPTTAGSYSVTATAKDSTGASGSAVFTWTVNGSGSGGTCDAAWSATTSYVPGNLVSYNGQNYKSLYWNTDVPPTSPIAWNIWQAIGACTG